MRRSQERKRGKEVGRELEKEGKSYRGERYRGERRIT